MARLIWLFLIFQAIVSARCLICGSSQAKLRLDKRRSEAGEPLFLTPYIERGALAEARRRARVSLGESLPVDSYAGYFTVDKAYDSNQFLWYFPSQEKDNGTSPVVVWLNGGPGASSLFGLFEENGPFTVINQTIQLREYHWARNHHLIYIDNPVGAGFSFTREEKGYCTDQTQVGEQLYSTVTQFFKLFPELQQNKFFVSGESYAGKYVPALAYTIHTKNPTADTKINLQGVAIGNGWCDPEHQFVNSEYLYQIGLIDWNVKIKMKTYEDLVENHIKNRQWKNAQILAESIYSAFPNSISYYNYMSLKSDQDSYYGSLMQQSSFKKAIHVGEHLFQELSLTAYKALKNDEMLSVAPWIAELLDHYPVVIYNGQLDIIVAYPLTVNFLRHLKFSGAEEYARAERREWRVAGEVAGYVKTAGRLTELLVRGAGHSVPRDQPAWAWDMITRITHGQSFYD